MAGGGRGFGLAQYTEGDDELALTTAGGLGEGPGDRAVARSRGGVGGGEGAVLPAQYGSGETVVVTALRVLHDPPVGVAGQRGAQWPDELVPVALPGEDAPAGQLRCGVEAVMKPSSDDDAQSNGARRPASGSLPWWSLMNCRRQLSTSSATA